MRTLFRSGAVALAAMSLASCSTGGQRLTQSGFLGDYAKMQKVEDEGNDALWVAPSYLPARYTSVIVERPEWLAAKRDAVTQARLSQALHDQLTEQLGARYRILSGNPKPGTLRVRTAITDTRRTRWFANVPEQVAYSAVVGGVGTLLAPLQGGASVEMQVEDAQVGQPLVRMAAYRNGKRCDVKGNYVAYRHAEQAFDKAATLLHGAMTGNGEVVMRVGKLAYEVPKDHGAAQ